MKKRYREVPFFVGLLYIITRNKNSDIISSRKASPFFFPLSPSARSLHPPPAAVAHQALTGFAVASDLSISANEKGTPFGVPFFVGKYERNRYQFN